MSKESIFAIFAFSKSTILIIHQNMKNMLYLKDKLNLDKLFIDKK